MCWGIELFSKACFPSLENDGPICWGIVSAGSISNVFVTALKGLPADEHQVK